MDANELKPFSEGKTDDAMKFAMDMIQGIPKGDSQTTEAYMTAVLVIFMGALWGTFGTEYARGFIQAQLNSMKGAPEKWIPPKTH